MSILHTSTNGKWESESTYQQELRAPVLVDWTVDCPVASLHENNCQGPIVLITVRPRPSRQARQASMLLAALLGPETFLSVWLVASSSDLVDDKGN